MSFFKVSAQCGGLFGIRDVEFETPAFEGRRRVFEFAGVASGQDDVVAVVAEGTAEVLAQSSVASGDADDLLLFVHFPASRLP